MVKKCMLCKRRVQKSTKCKKNAILLCNVLLGMRYFFHHKRAIKTKFTAKDICSRYWRFHFQSNYVQVHLRSMHLLQCTVLQCTNNLSCSAFVSKYVHCTSTIVWTQWWSFADVSQQGLNFSKKISKRKIFFWFDFHRCSHGSSKSA